MSQPLWNSIGVLLLGVAITYFWRLMDKRVRDAYAEKAAIEKKAADIKKGHDELVEQVRALQVKVSVVEQVAAPLNALMQQALIKELTHLHTPEMDALLVKVGGLDENGVVQPNTLTNDEEERLAVMLKERATEANGRIDTYERDAAIMLPMVLKRVKREVEASKLVDPELKLVAVVSDAAVDLHASKTAHHESEPES